ncbi:MAG: hypothetical protein WA667_06820, partial [Candidatus Nitrosopolaris sp.]
ISILFIISTVGRIRYSAAKLKIDTYSIFIARISDVGFIALIAILIPALILPFRNWCSIQMCPAILCCIVYFGG